MTHLCIINANFYDDISQELLKGAVAEIKKRGNITFDIFTVPGVFEIPAVMSIGIKSGAFQGYVALGCVIRGETTHYDYVCLESARGINELAMQHQSALGYGILTVENEEQAWVRAKIDQGNKGADAVNACLRMLEIKRTMGLL